MQVLPDKTPEEQDTHWVDEGPKQVLQGDEQLKEQLLSAVLHIGEHLPFANWRPFEQIKQLELVQLRQSP